MIIYRRRAKLSNRAAGELPESPILWRNTFIAWCLCGWGLLAGITFPGPQSPYGSFLHRFSVRHFGADSNITELILAISEVPGMLLYGFIAACVIGGAFVGLFMMFTSTVVALHRSWRIDDAALLSGQSERDSFEGPSFSL